MRDHDRRNLHVRVHENKKKNIKAHFSIFTTAYITDTLLDISVIDCGEFHQGLGLGKRTLSNC